MKKRLWLTALLLLSSAVMADKKTPSELKWGDTDTKENCLEVFCVQLEPPSPSLTEKIKKADRLRRTDPFSPHNSDNSDQGRIVITFPE
ncbi:UNVERIFIED_ORG: hypothetical protein FHU01_4438 [Citrobacter freundii]